MDIFVIVTGFHKVLDSIGCSVLLRFLSFNGKCYAEIIFFFFPLLPWSLEFYVMIKKISQEVECELESKTTFAGLKPTEQTFTSKQFFPPKEPIQETQRN